jgi:hypothetical protein
MVLDDRDALQCCFSRRNVSNHSLCKCYRAFIAVRQLKHHRLYPSSDSSPSQLTASPPPTTALLPASLSSAHAPRSSHPASTRSAAAPKSPRPPAHSYSKHFGVSMQKYPVAPARDPLLHSRLRARLLTTADMFQCAPCRSRHGGPDYCPAADERAIADS